MAKRDAQTFEWKSIHAENGTYLKLEIIGRKDGPMEGEHLTFGIGEYPTVVVERILAAGHKAVFQQRTSQCETDDERLDYWTSLHALFKAGDWEKEGGTRGAPVIAAWIEAAAEHKGCTPGAFQAAWSAYEKAQRDAIKAKCEAQFAKRIEEIKAARKDADVKLDDML